MTRVATLLLALAFATPTAFAIDNAKQLLSGGFRISPNSVRYTAPGLGTVFGMDYPATGKGISAASIPMPAGGRLSRLRVHIVTEDEPTSGTMAIECSRMALPPT